MPSLKRSETRKAKYGTRNHHDLLFALNLLLQLKGAAFQTKTPDFLIPSAEEFLGYCQAVNTNFSKTRVRFVTKRRAPRIRRPLLASAKPIPERLTAFALFIVGNAYTTTTPFEHFLLCATIVMEACFNYLFVIEYLKNVTHGAKNPATETMETMNTPTFHHAIQKLMKCYFDLYCSSIVLAKQPTTDILYNYLNLYLVPLYKLPTTPTGSIAELTKLSVHAFDTLYTDEKFLRKQIQEPLAHLFGKEGFVLEDRLVGV